MGTAPMLARTLAGDSKFMEAVGINIWRAITLLTGQLHLRRTGIGNTALLANARG